MVVPVTASENVAVLLAATVIVVLLTAELNVEDSSIVNVDRGLVPPIILANVVPPELFICKTPTPDEVPLIVPVTVIAAGVSADATTKVPPVVVVPSVIVFAVTLFFTVAVLLAATFIEPTVLVLPITPVNILLPPVILIVPSLVAAPLIAFVIVAELSVAKTMVAVAPDVVSSKVTGPLPLNA